ncbi:hypothetical protein RPE78_08130 [Thioclava litoralis]|uniref:Tetratricopeptide repeat-containing protein n=1 Tax=Thioclava litoralis TaxID=3076557 RepID=A0ABZ1DY74_9RHOB|nr:hypothetical protein RPE78_08130 [Thioclava sp. FTW29]
MRHLFLGTLLATIASVAAAQTITVQSGEHPDFTRLVFLFRGKVDWSLEQNENGYAFSVNKPDVKYDLSKVFYFIPRTRISELYPVNGSSALDIATPEGIALTAFELASGAVVVDARLAPQEAPARPQSPAAPQIEITTPIQNPSIPATRIALPDPDIYWRLSETPAAQTSVTPAPVNVRPSVEPAPARTKEVPPVQGALALDQLMEEKDKRVSEAETQLLHQLSRAASQGLIELELPTIPDPEPAPAAVTPPPPEPTRKTEHIAIHSETVVDRDAGSLQMQFGDMLNDSRCAPNADFALREWSEEGDPFALISNLRRSLIGEFDKPNEQGALRLAQTYLAFGFGAEAQSILQNFPIDPEAQDAVKLMANVIDGEPVSSANPLLAMSACDGAVAFWAMMGQEKSDPLSVNLKAVQRTYSDLPISLRRTLGVPLVNKLTALGYPEEAETVRFSLERGENEKSLQAVMLDATIDHGHADAAAIEQSLKPVVERDNEDAVVATLLIAETAFRDHHPMDELVLENAAALAIELQPSPDAAKLLRAEALGRASRSDWNGAMTTLANWPKTLDAPLHDSSRKMILQRAIRDLADQDLLVFYFQHKDVIAQAGLDTADYQLIAKRLIDLGLPSNVQSLLQSDQPLSPASRLLMAKAALLEHDGPAAMTYVSGLESDEAQAIRVQAQNYFAGGDALNQGGAAPQLSDESPDSALRRRDWAALAQSGSDSEKAFVQAFDLANPSPEPPADGELSNAQRLLNQSAEERDALSQLLESLN